MPARILLVRHGRSAYVHHGHWVTWDGALEFERGYNAAGIRDDDEPPAEVVEAARAAHIVAASDLPRAIASVQRLVPGREPDVSPLLRELTFEPIRWVPFRLPVHVWDMVSYTQWTLRLFLGGDHEHVRRADAAANWVLERATDGASVLVVTHGGFRRLLDVQLGARGWQRTPAPRSFANWSTWSYAR